MLLNNHNAVASPFSSTRPTAYDSTTGTDSSSSSSDSTTSTATITADDFLQLLVTELQNQDPTANTDPNEYVDQLVQVNSLQQLIQINDNTTPSTTTTTSSSSGDAAGTGATADLAAVHGAGVSAAGAGSSPSANGSTSASAAESSLTPATAEERRLHHSEHTGNLSANVDTQSTMAASATRVASSLQPRRPERITSPGTSAITSGRFSAH